jgi:Tfp pilus assembly protein PilO
VNLRTASATALLGGLALLLVGALSWVLLLGPATAHVSEQREAAEAAADRSALLSLQLTRLQAKAADLGDTEEAEQRLASLFPPTADQPGFFEQVGKAAAAAGYSPADVTSLSPSAPTPLVPPVPETAPVEPAEGTEPGAEAATAAPAAAPDLAVQTVTMTMTGSYDEARRLLAGLEDLDRAYLLRSVSLSGEAGSSSLTLSISGVTYVAPPVPRPTTDEKSQAG